MYTRLTAKAVLKLGELSRRGSSRGKEAVKAQAKDLGIKEKLVPFGILEVQIGEFTIVFGTSRETSDFIVECLVPQIANEVTPGTVFAYVFAI